MPAQHGPRAVPSDAAAHADRIANAVDTAWTNQHSSGTDLHIPVSVTAALSLQRQADPHGPNLGTQITELDPNELAAYLRHTWRQFVVLRPDLTARTAPLLEWLWRDPSDWQLNAAHAVAHNAIRAGLLEFTSDETRRHGADLFAALLQILRSHKTKAARGEFYTSQDVAEAIAINLGIAAIQPGQRFYEPTAGTGSMLCAAARVLRQHGKNPADILWYAIEIDPLAAACLAINAHLWNLGPNVIIGCGNSLDPTTLDRALDERKAGILGLRTLQLIALTPSTHAAKTPRDRDDT